MTISSVVFPGIAPTATVTAPAAATVPASTLANVTEAAVVDLSEAGQLLALSQQQQVATLTVADANAASALEQALSAAQATANAAAAVLAEASVATPTVIDPAVAAAMAETATLLASPLDPAVAAAVAAYRVGESVAATKTNIEEEPVPESIGEVVQVLPVGPVTLDTQKDADDERRNAQVAAALRPGHASVDVKA